MNGTHDGLPDEPLARLTHLLTHAIPDTPAIRAADAHALARRLMAPAHGLTLRPAAPPAGRGEPGGGPGTGMGGQGRALRRMRPTI